VEEVNSSESASLCYITVIIGQIDLVRDGDLFHPSIPAEDLPARRSCNLRYLFEGVGWVVTIR
jgi:hypothetical protein